MAHSGKIKEVYMSSATPCIQAVMYIYAALAIYMPVRYLVLHRELGIYTACTEGVTHGYF
jgi:hypothetical protein